MGGDERSALGEAWSAALDPTLPGRTGVLRIAESGDPREVVASVARPASLDALRDDLDVDRATDVAYSILHHAIWTRLIDECGGSADEAERWYADTLIRVLLPSDR